MCIYKYKCCFMSQYTVLYYAKPGHIVYCIMLPTVAEESKDGELRLPFSP